MKKYVWTFLTICVICLCSFTFKVHAADNGEFRYEEVTNDYGSGMILLEYLGSAEEVIIPEKLDGEPVVEIGSLCFAENEGLKKVTIPDSVTRVGGFSYCTNLETVELGKNVRELSTSGTAYPWHGTFSGCSALHNIELPEGLVEIGANAFEGCKSLKNIYLPDGLKRIASSAFADCTSLEQISIPDSVEVMMGYRTGNKWFSPSYYGAAFENCTALKKVKLPKNLSIIGSSTFYGCSALKMVVWPEALEEIGNGAFMGCSSLSEINLPKSVFCIEPYAFGGCTSLKEFIFTPKQINNKKAQIGWKAFIECTALEKVVIDAPITSIEKQTFSNCTALKSVTLPEGVTGIFDKAFYNCKSLKKINLPTDLNEIGKGAFQYSGLKSITIPKNMAALRERAFARCSSLKKIVIEGKYARIGLKAFTGIAADAVFDVPNKYVKVYKSRLTKKNTGFISKSMRVI